jgi:hypothetical protein
MFPGSRMRPPRKVQSLHPVEASVESALTCQQVQLQWHISLEQTFLKQKKLRNFNWLNKHNNSNWTHSQCKAVVQMTRKLFLILFWLFDAATPPHRPLRSR